MKIYMSNVYFQHFLPGTKFIDRSNKKNIVNIAFEQYSYKIMYMYKI